MNAALEPAEEGVIRVRGELTFATVTALLAASKSLFDDHDLLMFDFKQVTHANSAGLALMLEWLSVGKALEIPVQFLSVPESLLAITEMSNLGFLISQ